MKNFARAFDQPLESREHQQLATNAWLGGDSITVRYWLGRLLNHNFFRESDDAVEAALSKFFTSLGYQKGVSLLADRQSWSPIATLLQHKVEVESGCEPTKNPRLVAALQAVMHNPALSDSQLAAIAQTTERQICRMVDVQLLLILWKRQQG